MEQCNYITIYNIHMKNHVYPYGKNSAKIEEKPCLTCLRIANTARAKNFEYKSIRLLHLQF